MMQGIRMAKKSRKKAPRTAREERYTWTIMLYLAGDNNLSDEMIWAIKEVYRVGTPPNVAVTIQFDPSLKKRATRFYIIAPSERPVDADGILSALHDEEVAESDSGDPKTVADFVEKSMKAAPAEHYMLILAGHGSGIVGEFLADQGQEKQPGSLSLTIPNLHQLFPDLRTRLGEEFLHEYGKRPLIDVLGLDTCLMSMAEVCSEIVREVSFLVCSEGFDPNTGWPYFRLLQKLAEYSETHNHHLPSPEEMAKGLVEQYVVYYADFEEAEVSVDMSACDVGGRAISRLERSVAELVSYYLATDKTIRKVIRNAIVLAHWRAQSYKLEEYTDLGDFCGLLRAECLDLWRLVGRDRGSPFKEMATKCRAVLVALNAMVKATNFTGPDFQHSHGLSVYFPWSRKHFAEEYRNTGFAQRTGWASLLDAYLDETRRRRRARVLPAQRQKGARLARTDGSITGIESHVTQPARFDPPSERFDPPSERFDVPSERFDPPSERFDPPSERFAPPSGRFDPPSERFAQILGSLVHELPSKMKNPPLDADPLITLSSEDRARIKNLKTGRIARYRRRR